MLVSYSSSSEDEREAGREAAVAADRNKSFSRKFQEEDGGEIALLRKKKPKIKEAAPTARCV